MAPVRGSVGSLRPAVAWSRRQRPCCLMTSLLLSSPLVASKREGLARQGTRLPAASIAAQDEADALGGCWRAYVNIVVGFKHLKAAIARDGITAGIAAYNGSGPAAQAYAKSVLRHALVFQEALAKVKVAT